MSIAYRPMRPGQEEAVATLVRQLAKDLGYSPPPAVTGEQFRQWHGQHHVMVAENAGLLCGICTWYFIYSTWRGAKGVYVSDLYVLGHQRGRKIGEGLLRATMRDAARMGASYAKLDVRAGMPRQRAFYARLGFAPETEIDSLALEAENFSNLIGEHRT
jgi:ribosomal protein S18 acetylase RimI-like enzyme